MGVKGCYHRRAFEEHESGPEIIARLVLGAAGLTIVKSVIDLVTAIINARKISSIFNLYKSKLLAEHRYI